jgi:hypothetical protein
MGVAPPQISTRPMLLADGRGVDSTEARCYPFAAFKGSGHTKDIGKEGRFLRRITGPQG